MKLKWAIVVIIGFLLLLGFAVWVRWYSPWTDYYESLPAIWTYGEKGLK